MALDSTQQNNKPSRKGFFVLIAIIVVVIFAAYALTKRHNDKLAPEISSNEQQMLASQFKDVQTTPVTQKELKALSKSYGTVPKALTQDERDALSRQFSN